MMKGRKMRSRLQAHLSALERDSRIAALISSSRRVFSFTPTAVSHYDQLHTQKPALGGMCTQAVKRIVHATVKCLRFN